jgi:hypothetical protein
VLRPVGSFPQAIGLLPDGQRIAFGRALRELTVAIIDPDAHAQSAKGAGNDEVEIVVAIDVPGADAETAGGARVDVEGRAQLRAEANLDPVTVSPVYTALRPGIGDIGAIVAIEIAYPGRAVQEKAGWGYCRGRAFRSKRRGFADERARGHSQSAHCLDGE